MIQVLKNLIGKEEVYMQYRRKEPKEAVYSRRKEPKEAVYSRRKEPKEEVYSGGGSLSEEQTRQL